MILMIDGKNCLYRAVFARQRIASKEHTAVLILRLINQWIQKFNPTSIYCFWDAPKRDVWRMKHHGGYKDREHNDRLYGADIKEEMASIEGIVRELLGHLGVYQFHRKEMEADDLIYAACKVHFPNPITVVSSDSDLTQLKYYMPNVDVFNAIKNELVVRPEINPVWQKALIGDKSDVIDGYDGIGPVKSTAILETVDKLAGFIEKDERLFLRNLLLIDLSLCPALLANQMYVLRVVKKGTDFNKRGVIDMIDRYKLSGLRGIMHDVVTPFKSRATRAAEQ